MTRRKTTQTLPDTQAPDEAVDAAPSDFKAIYHRIQAKRAAVAPPSLEPEQAILPGVTVPKTPGDTAPMNNYLARTPLFSPIKRGARRMLDRVRLASPEGCNAYYTGKQLDMADQDGYLVLLQLAAEVGPDQPVILNRADLLRRMGWKTVSKAAYAWIDGLFARLATGTIELDTPKLRAWGRLMGKGQINKETGEFQFSIPAESLSLFGGKDELAHVDLAKRRALEKRADLAKWIQTYATSHKQGQHSVSVENLHKWSGSQQRMRDFREGLAEALDELRRVGVLTAWEFAERQKKVRWNR